MTDGGVEGEREVWDVLGNFYNNYHVATAVQIYIHLALCIARNCKQQ